MRSKQSGESIVLALVLGLVCVTGVTAAPLTTAITYQGQLKENGVPANGNYTMDFKLFDGPVSPPAVQVGLTVSQMVNVVNGLFTVELNAAGQFGAAAFDGNERWLEATVGLAVLSPRQKVNATPAALSLRLPFVQSLDSGASLIDVTNTGTGRVLRAARNGPGSLAAIRADSTGDSALWGQGSTINAEGVTAISTGGADALDAQSQGTTGRAGDFEITNATNTAAAVFASTAGTGPAVHAEGLLQIGSNLGTGGELELFANGSAVSVVHAYGTSHGGNLDLRTETGDFIGGIESDLSGTGGFLFIRRDASMTGFSVDGNVSGTEEPRVAITGTSRSMSFDPAALNGNASVVFPIGSIAAAEMLDEPGVASETEGTSTISLDGTTQTLLSRSITAPAAGFVLAIASAQANCTHTNGATSACTFGVSDTAGSLPTNQDVAFSIPSVLPTSGSYSQPIAVHGLFQVAAGPSTFFFIGDESAGAWTVNDLQLSLVYLPTSYGTVSPTLDAVVGGDAAAAESDSTALRQASELSAPTRGGRTVEEIATERTKSIADNQSRVEREMAEMQQQLAQLQKELAEVHAAQRAAATANRGRPVVKVLSEGAGN